MSSHAALRSSVIITVSAGFVIVAAGAAAMPARLALGPAYPVKALAVFGCAAVLVARNVRGGHPFQGFGAANTVTTIRMALVALVTALVGEHVSAGTATTAVAFAAGVTACDGLDGWLARRTAMASEFGARFDMETDALLIMALSVLTWQHGKAGAWVVLSGLLRYLFVIAGWAWPWMAQPLPPRFRRKAMCVAQIVGLLLALLPAVAPPASTLIAAVSLALLAWSFGVDTWWLSHHRVTPTRSGVRASPSSSTYRRVNSEAGIPVGTDLLTMKPSQAGPRRLLTLIAALVLLDATVTFRNVWPTPYVSWRGELSVELAIVVLALAVLALRFRPLPRRLAGWVAGIWTAMVIGHYLDVTAAAVYGRNVNLYWDVRRLSSVAGLLAGAAHVWLTIAVVLAIVAIPLLVFWPVRWAFRQVAAMMAVRWLRGVLAAAAAVIVGCYAAGVGTGGDNVEYGRLPELPVPVTTAWARQGRLLAKEVTSRGRAEIPPSPPLTSAFSRINGADVLLVFVESYGAVSWDRPSFASPLAASRAQFERDVRETGREVVSAFVESPTFGGSSWLAHISLLSGIDVRDDDTSTVLMTQKRDTLVTTFARHGYRTVGVMPGLQSEWPEGAFYGFDHVYDGAHLDYRGPDFGWWTVPDQYTFAWLGAHEIAPRARPPVFVVFPTITTHTPFSPIAPYQPDWRRLLTDTPYDEAAVELATDESPDWMNLGPDYVRALTYDFQSIGGLLRVSKDRDLVMILIGDHQPPSAVSGEHASWEVPVHVVSSRRELLDRLVARGFRRGLAPAHPSLGRMNDLTRVLVDAF